MDTTKQIKDYTEAEIRAMRDVVFEHNSTDANWQRCGEAWMQPEAILWLVKESNYGRRDK